MLLRTLASTFLFQLLSSVLLGTYLGAELPGCVVILVKGIYNLEEGPHQNSAMLAP